MSYVKLGITLSLSIFIGVFFANVASTEVSKATLERQLTSTAEKAANKLRIEKEIRDKNRQRQAEINSIKERERQQALAEKNRKNRIERDRQNNSQKQRIQTCNFWREQYKKTGRTDDKIHRNNACKEINNF